MTRKLSHLVAVAGAAAVLALTPTVAVAQTLEAESAVRCLITIDSPWGEICLVPDVWS